MIVVDSQPHAAREKEILERVQEIGGYGNARCGYWQGEAVVGGEGNRGSERVRTDSSIRKHDASYGIPSPETNPVKSPLLLLCTSRRAARIKGSSNREVRSGTKDARLSNNSSDGVLPSGTAHAGSRELIREPSRRE